MTSNLTYPSFIYGAILVLLFGVSCKNSTSASLAEAKETEKLESKESKSEIDSTVTSEIEAKNLTESKVEKPEGKQLEEPILVSENTIKEQEIVESKPPAIKIKPNDKTTPPKTEQVEKAQKKAKVPAKIDPIVKTPEVKEPEVFGEPEIIFRRNFFNFGKVESGTVVEGSFEFTNIGTAPLVIKNATATCGCTVPDYPKNPINPGEKATIDVVFDTKGKMGRQQPIITVSANTTPAIHKLYMDGELTELEELEIDSLGEGR